MSAGGEGSRSLPGGIAWVGAGRTALLGPAGRERVGEVAEIRGAADLPGAFGAAIEGAFSRAVREYFAAGGGPCFVLNLPPVAGPGESRGPGEGAGEWLGQDDGPGYRTGAHAVLDIEDVGTIAAPGLLNRDLRRALLSLCADREDRFVLLDALPGGELEELPAQPCAALAQGWRRDEDGRMVPPSGALLAALEENDFLEERPQPCLRRMAAGGHPTLAPDRLPTVEAWRLREGLRRSLDRGTRWVVFEGQGDLLWRRVEREAAAFLARLQRLGIFERKLGEDAFRVQCGPGDPGEGRLAGAQLVIEVEARLRGLAGAGTAPRATG